MRGRLGLFAIALGLSALATAPAKAWNTDFCKAVVLQPIGQLYVEAEGMAAADIPPTIEKGTVIQRVTQYVVDRKTGLTGFCAHFDTCYRATATVNGKQVKAVRLLNCTIDFKHPSKSEDEVIYGLDLDPRRNSARDI